MPLLLCNILYVVLFSSPMSVYRYSILSALSGFSSFFFVRTGKKETEKERELRRALQLQDTEKESTATKKKELQTESRRTTEQTTFKTERREEIEEVAEISAFFLSFVIEICNFEDSAGRGAAPVRRCHDTSVQSEREVWRQVRAVGRLASFSPSS